MNGFLLMLIHEMDDCPIGLYATRDECLDAAGERRIDWGLSNDEAEILQTDASTPMGLVAIEFCDGWPVKREVVAWIGE